MGIKPAARWMMVEDGSTELHWPYFCFNDFLLHLESHSQLFALYIGYVVVSKLCAIYGLRIRWLPSSYWSIYLTMWLFQYHFLKQKFRIGKQQHLKFRWFDDFNETTALESSTRKVGFSRMKNGFGKFLSKSDQFYKTPIVLGIWIG